MTSCLLLRDLSSLRFMPQVDLAFGDSIDSMEKRRDSCHDLPQSLGYQLRTRLTMRLISPEMDNVSKTMPSTFEPTAIHAALFCADHANIPQVQGDGMML